MREAELKKLLSKLVFGLTTVVVGVAVLWLVLLVKYSGGGFTGPSAFNLNIDLAGQSGGLRETTDSRVVSAVVTGIEPRQRTINDKQVVLPGQYVISIRAAEVYNEATGQAATVNKDLKVRATSATTIVRIPDTSDGEAALVDATDIKSNEKLIVYTREGITERRAGDDYPTALYIEIIPAQGDPRLNER